MRSWDCWDTLIARRTVIDVGNERDNLFPIAENVAQVEPQDILISDYYDAPLLRREVPRITGLRNRLIVTENGKYTGKVWRRLKTFGITEHTGDNPHSDVESPDRHGIRGRLSRLAEFTREERELHDSGLMGLARTVREARLAQFSHSFRPLELLQIEVNFPLLFIASVLLHRQHSGGRILMSSRDCCLWQHVQRIVRDLHGSSYEVIYFMTSRIARAFPSVRYLDYVNAMLPGVIVDVAGTGWSLSRLLEQTGCPETRVVLITRYEDNDLQRRYQAIAAIRDKSNINVLFRGCLTPTDLETMNAALHAMYDDPPGTFNPLNLDWSSVPEIEVMHAAFSRAVRVAAHYDFQSDIQVPEEILQQQLVNCMRRVNEYRVSLARLHSLLHAEDHAVMQRLEGLSASGRGQSCVHSA